MYRWLSQPPDGRHGHAGVMKVNEEYTRRMAEVTEGFDGMLKAAEDLSNAWLYEITEEARAEFERDHPILHAHVLAVLSNCLKVVKTSTGLDNLVQQMDGSRRQG